MKPVNSISGEKTEEYRELKDFWHQRLYHKQDEPGMCWFKDFTHVHFFNGGHFGEGIPNAKFECNGITIGVPRPEWSDNAQGNHFIIHIGKRVEI
jgi:hypothetical protein